MRAIGKKKSNEVERAKHCENTTKQERANLKEKTRQRERAIFFMGGKKKADENGRLLTRKEHV